MLHSLLVADIPAAEKKKIVHDEFGIPMNKSIDREVEDMCNISSLFINRGMEKGRAEGMKLGRAEGRAEGIEIGTKKVTNMIKEMAKNNILLPTIGSIAHLSVEEVEKIIAENT